jgi:hypothetical protein
MMGDVLFSKTHNCNLITLLEIWNILDVSEHVGRLPQFIF